MKVIGIVFLVFAGLGVVLAVGGGLRTLTQEEGAINGMAIIRTAQSQLLRYGFHALSWAGLGVCCLAVDAARKREPEIAEAPPSSSTASPAKAPQAAAPVSQAGPAAAAKPAAAPAPAQAAPAKPAAPARPAPTITPAKPAQSAPDITPARPPIRPASDVAPKRNEQDTPGQ